MSFSIDQVLLRAKRLEKKGETKLAAQQYQLVLDAFPNNKRAKQGLSALGQPSNNSRNFGIANQRLALPPQIQVEELMSYYKQGKLVKALQLGKRLAEQFPNSLLIFNVLGAVYVASGKLELAVSAYSKAREIDPGVAEVHNNLGLALNEMGKSDQAVKSYEKALLLKPNYAGALNNLGLALSDLEQYGKAVEVYLKALKLDPNFAEAYNNIGVSQNSLNLHDRALVSYDKAIKINPMISDIHKNKGMALSQIGRNGEAASCLADALRLSSAKIDPGIIITLADLPEGVVDFDLLSLHQKVALELPKDNSHEWENKMDFAKSKILHNLGRFEDAWESFEKANLENEKLAETEFQLDMKRDRILLKDAQNRSVRDIATDSISDIAPVSLYILGSSRSGKTTIERLLKNATEVKPGFESPLLESAIKNSCDEAGIEAPTFLHDIPAELEGGFRKHYFKLLRSNAELASVYTLTSPGSIRNISRAVDILPNIRIVFVKRNIDDLVLRIFVTRYRSANSYAYNIENIRAYVHWYNEMIDILHSKFPHISMVVNYEDLIRSPRDVLKSISELCKIDIGDIDIPHLGDDQGCAKPYLEKMAGVM